MNNIFNTSLNEKCIEDEIIEGLRNQNETQKDVIQKLTSATKALNEMNSKWGKDSQIFQSIKRKNEGSGPTEWINKKGRGKCIIKEREWWFKSQESRFS